MAKPIKTSALVWAFKYNLELAARPLSNVTMPMAMVTLISKCMLRFIKYINRLPMPNRCILHLKFRNNNTRALNKPAISPKK
jgi:hypothetical protein